jgi:hypothetical protein
MTDRFDYIRNYYGVPACVGRRVVVDGQPGVIAEVQGHYIGVLFDSDKPSRILPCHPTSGVEYGDMGEVRPMTRSQRRYQRFLDADGAYGTFREFLEYETACRRRAREREWMMQ